MKRYGISLGASALALLALFFSFPRERSAPFAPSAEPRLVPPTRLAVAKASPAPPRTHSPPGLRARYLEAKRNVFFREADLRREASRPETIEEMKRFLADSHSLDALPAGNFMEIRPEVLLERMAAIDLLELAGARGALAEVVRRQWPEGTTARVKRILLGERYDALMALTRISPEEALREYRDLESPLLKERLRDAIVAGLVDRGATREEALARCVQASSSAGMN